MDENKNIQVTISLFKTIHQIGGHKNDTFSQHNSINDKRIAIDTPLIQNRDTLTKDSLVFSLFVKDIILKN